MNKQSIMKSLDKLWDPYPHSYLRILLIFSLIHVLVPSIQISSLAVVSISLYTIFSFFILYLNHLLVTLHRGFLDFIGNGNVSIADIEGVEEEATYRESPESDTSCDGELRKERTVDWTTNGDSSKDEELRKEEEFSSLLRQALRTEMDEREEEKSKFIVQLQKATDDLELYKSLLHDADK